MNKRNKILDWGSRFFDGLTGGKKADVAEGVEGKTKRLYETYGSNKQETEGYAEKMAPTVVPNDDSDEARRKRARTRQHARDNGYL